MIHLQVKAKSGLHAGAMWQLDNSTVSLGSNSHSDVFLCDPDIPDTLIELRRTGRRYTIESVHNEARLLSPDQRKVDQTLFPSQLLTLDFRHIQLELEVLNASYGLASRANDSIARSLHRVVQLLRGIGARAIAALLFVIGLLITATVLFFGTAGVVKSEVPEKKKEHPQAQRLNRPEPVSPETQMTRVIESQLNEFAQKVNARGFEVKVQSKKVEVTAMLSRSQAMGFEKLLSRIVHDYGQKIDVVATLRLSDEQRLVDEIEVEQVILGNKPVVVLRDGVRLYLGGRYQGVNLVSVDANKLVFEGESTYEVSL